MIYKPNKKDRWSATQTQFLIENYGEMIDEEIAAVLNRTLKSVRLKRARLGLDKAHGKGVCRTREEWERIKKIQ